MKNYLYTILLLSAVNLFSQSEKETAYLLFDTNEKEKCEISIEQTHKNKKEKGLIQKYRKEKIRDRITFYICEESFLLDKKSKIDTCNYKNLSKIKFETLETLKSKRKTLKSKYFFKNSVFNKIYLVEKQKSIIIKYPVIWNSDLIEN